MLVSYVLFRRNNSVCAIRGRNGSRLTYQEAALKYGVAKSTICKWMKKASEDQKTYIDTQSSRRHPHEL